MNKNDQIQQILERHQIKDPTEFLLKDPSLEAHRKSLEERIERAFEKLRYM